MKSVKTQQKKAIGFRLNLKKRKRCFIRWQKKSITIILSNQFPMPSKHPAELGKNIPPHGGSPAEIKVSIGMQSRRAPRRRHLLYRQPSGIGWVSDWLWSHKNQRSIRRANRVESFCGEGVTLTNELPQRFAWSAKQTGKWKIWNWNIISHWFNRTMEDTTIFLKTFFQSNPRQQGRKQKWYYSSDILMR